MRENLLHIACDRMSKNNAAMLQRFCGLARSWYGLGALVLALSGCGETVEDVQQSPLPSPRSIQIEGAGASAPGLLYQRWIKDYTKQHPNLKIRYQSIGSGAGIQQFLKETVDFAGSDRPLKPADRQRYPAKRGQPIQIPSVGQFLAVIYNLPGVQSLKLSRSTYCGIFRGKVKAWNAPEIVKDNPGVKLPNRPIKVVYRSDGSMITLSLTQHLASICPGWQAGVGRQVKWEFVGIGSKGSADPLFVVQQTPGAIAAVEYSYAKENQLPMALLQNRAGQFVAPAPETATNALRGVVPAQDFSISVSDPAQPDAYPIVTVTYWLLYGRSSDTWKATDLRSFVQWALRDGAASAAELGYAPLPAELVERSIAALESTSERISPGQ